MKQLVLCSLLGVFFACTSPETTDGGEGVQPASAQGVSTDSALFFLARIDSGAAQGEELIRAAYHFSKADSLLRSDATYLMKAGLVCMSVPEHRLVGVNYLIALTRTYPTHPYAPEALMQLSLFFQNEIQDEARAADYLRTLLERYPTHALAGDAQQLLLLLGGSEEEELETVKSWLNNNNE